MQPASSDKAQPAAPPPQGSPPLYDSGDPRIYLAAERTHLAWVRTGLALMGFGFVVARFGLFLRELASAGHIATGTPAPQHPRLSLYVGLTLVGLGVLMTVAASIKHYRRINQLRRGEPIWEKPISLELVVGVLLSLVGLATGLYLLGIIGG